MSTAHGGTAHHFRALMRSRRTFRASSYIPRTALAAAGVLKRPFAAITGRPSVYLQRQQRAVCRLASAGLHGAEPGRDRQLALHLGVDAREVVHEPVGAGANRQAQADVQVAVVVVLVLADAAAVEDVQRV